MASRALVLILLVGCARTTVTKTAVSEHAGAEMEFWDAIADTRAVSNHDALHALLVTFEVKAGDSYKSRLDAARKRNWIDAAEELPEKETARVGWIASAVCIETGIKGGATMRVFGARERYAVRELNYREWLANMTPSQAMSGMQLIALLGEAEDMLAEKGEG